MLDEKPMTAFQVCQQLFPAVYEKELFLTMSETAGHLDVLELKKPSRHIGKEIPHTLKQ